MVEQTKEELKSEVDALKAENERLTEENKQLKADNDAGIKRKEFNPSPAPGFAPHEKAQAEQDEKDRQAEAKRLADEAKK